MIISIFSNTGQILRVTQCPTGMANIQCQQGEDWIDGAYEGNDYYIENYVPIAKPQRPSEHHVFNYSAKQWVDPRTTESEWYLVRQRRNQLLTSSDWTQLPDVPIATKAAWAAYRQALRDITTQAGFPDPVVWPTPPS